MEKKTEIAVAFWVQGLGSSQPNNCNPNPRSPPRPRVLRTPQNLDQGPLKGYVRQGEDRLQKLGGWV